MASTGTGGRAEASVFRQADGSHVVAFRNLSVSSVPDPVLYIMPGADQEGIDGAVRLGRFERSRDSYTIPAGFDVLGPLTVISGASASRCRWRGASHLPI